MVFEAGSQPNCVLSSSLDAVRVIWLFDCDPEDQIAHTASSATSATAPANALSWAWSWLRPQVDSSDWDHNDLVLLPACGPTCAFLLDFNWLSLEPNEASTVQTAPAAAGAAAPGTIAVEQTNEAFATATASAESVIEQVLIQTGGDQAALQEASIAQLVSAQAAAGLADVRNVAVGIGAHANQTNRAATEVSAIATAEIVQLLAQTQSGDDSFQTQAALQTATTSQQLHASANSTVAHASNWDLSLGGTSSQASTSSARASGSATASTWQVIEQEQQGNSSDQVQIAGQLADTTQQMEILAAAGVADARISSRLNGDSASLSRLRGRRRHRQLSERDRSAERAVPERGSGRRAAGVLPDRVRGTDRLHLGRSERRRHTPLLPRTSGRDEGRGAGGDAAADLGADDDQRTFVRSDRRDPPGVEDPEGGSTLAVAGLDATSTQLLPRAGCGKPVCAARSQHLQRFCVLSRLGRQGLEAGRGRRTGTRSLSARPVPGLVHQRGILRVGGNRVVRRRHVGVDGVCAEPGSDAGTVAVRAGR